MTNPIQFYFGSGSPYAWKVWLALEHKQLSYQAHRMTFDGGELKGAAFTAINPRQKVPALVDNGFAMYESSAMLEYLEDRYPDSGQPLWPGDVSARAIARRRAAEVLAYVDPINDKLFEEVFNATGAPPNLEKLAATKALLSAELAIIDGWLDGDFLAGERLSGADFTLYPYLAFLGRVDTRKPGYDMQALLPLKVGQWMKRIASLPYFAATYPPHWKA